MSGGMHKGTDESESMNFRPWKLRRAVKKATGIPIRAAISVDKTAILSVYITISTTRTSGN